MLLLINPKHLIPNNCWNLLICWLLLMSGGALYKATRLNLRSKKIPGAKHANRHPGARKSHGANIRGKTDYSATIRLRRRFWSKVGTPSALSLWCACSQSSVAHYMTLRSARPNMPQQTTGLLTAPAHSSEAEMRPGPIFQQLVRLSVVQGGKLGGKTVVTFL